jgi:hypothetical protein
MQEAHATERQRFSAYLLQDAKILDDPSLFKKIQVALSMNTASVHTAEWWGEGGWGGVGASSIA